MRRIVIERIYAILVCQRCGVERRKHYFMGMTGSMFDEHCLTCREIIPHTIVAHDTKFTVVTKPGKGRDE